MVKSKCPSSCPSCSTKQKKKRKKAKPVKKPEYDPNPTHDPWERERYLTRRTNWMWRLRPFLKEKNKKQCGTCEFGGRCHRIPSNERITAKIAAGKKCKDYKSVWKKILSDEKKFDWGF